MCLITFNFVETQCVERRRYLILYGKPNLYINTTYFNILVQSILRLNEPLYSWSQINNAPFNLGLWTVNLLSYLFWKRVNLFQLDKFGYFGSRQIRQFLEHQTKDIFFCSNVNDIEITQRL